jgi:hypothetical protein
MNWERRWRELVIAGGALAATACGSNSASDGQADASGGDDADFPITCCNAISDPCCYLICTGDPRYASCEQAETACSSKGGIYEEESDGSIGCSHLPEAGSGDAGAASDAADAAALSDAGDAGVASDAADGSPDVSDAANSADGHD